MKCENIRDRFPEYLAGILDAKAAGEIEQHISGCEACKKELDALRGDFSQGLIEEKADVKRIIKKTKMRFNLVVILSVAVILGFVALISIIPACLWGIQAVVNQPKASRALMDAVQFSQPETVNMWGNGSAQPFSLYVPLQIGTHHVVGHKFFGQSEYTGKMSVITGKVTAPSFIG